MIDELRDLTDNNYRWKLQDDSGFAVVAFSPESTSFECVRSFTQHDLSFIKPTFPLALKALLNWQLGHGNPHVYGHLVGSLLSLSLDDVIYCRHLRGKPHVLQHIYSYTPHPSNPDRVTLDGMVQNICKSSIDGVDIEFVTSVDPITVQVQKDDLDSRYPGWLERWALAEVLGLRRDELRRFIFPVGLAKAIPAELGEVHFD